MRPRLVILPGLLMCALVTRAPALTLVEEGRPVAVIVTADEPSESARRAALTLQKYIEKIGGARMEIRPESEATSGPKILVGHGREAREVVPDIPSGFTPELNEEGFVMKTRGDVLLLAGNENGWGDFEYRGTRIAVHKFLEDLGCRWFFPGEYGEVLPRMETISLGELDRRERPSFRLREIHISDLMEVTNEDRETFREWYDLNNLSDKPGGYGGDGSITRLAPPDEYFESHPHIYATGEDGERVRDMLCPTEPETMETAIRTVTDYFRAHPDALAFGFAPPDGQNTMCHCEDCQAALLGFTGKGYGDPSMSGVWFDFANRIAAAVHEEFPERWILTNGYANRVRLPETVKDFSPNLAVESAIIAACTLHRIGDPKCWQRIYYQQLLDRWTEELDFVFVYDYFPGRGLEGLPFQALHVLGHDLPYFERRGLWGFTTEGNTGWMVTHLNYYVRARLMWNADEDVDALVRDYCEKFYGTAADPVEEYIWSIEECVDQAEVHETWGRLTPWQRRSRRSRRGLIPPMSRIRRSWKKGLFAQSPEPGHGARSTQVDDLTHSRFVVSSRSPSPMFMFPAAGAFLNYRSLFVDPKHLRVAVAHVQTYR